MPPGLRLAMFGGHERLPAILTAVVSVGLEFLLFRKLKEDHRAEAKPCSLEPHCWNTRTASDQFMLGFSRCITAFAEGAVKTGVLPGYFWIAVLRSQRGSFEDTCKECRFLNRTFGGWGGGRLLDPDAGNSRRGCDCSPDAPGILLDPCRLSPRSSLLSKSRARKADNGSPWLVYSSCAGALAHTGLAFWPRPLPSDPRLRSRPRRPKTPAAPATPAADLLLPLSRHLTAPATFRVKLTHREGRHRH